jgi:O-methyltransferase involved in polyketide biosynthesis
MRTLMDDAEHWWSRAEETRTVAELMNDPEAQRIMFDIAEGYDRLAERAAERVANHKPDTVQ